MSSTPARPTRRTQEERKAETTSRLIEATIASIVELGYHRTTVKEICGRAGLSEGALFGRFDSRTDLVVAAAQEVVVRQLEELRTRFRRRSPDEDRTAVFIRTVHEVLGDPSSTVWFELMAAARTDEGLQERFVPVLSETYEALLDVVRNADLDVDVPDDELERRVLRLIRALYGETMSRLLIGADDQTDRFLDDQIRAFRDGPGVSGP